MSNTHFTSSSRTRLLNKQTEKTGPVVYWMTREHRVHDNWSLLYAQQLAQKHNSCVIVVFNLLDSFSHASFRHYDFMLKGLKEVKTTLESYNIDFVLLSGDPLTNMTQLLKELDPATVVVDFSPLKSAKKWAIEVSKAADCAVFQVDAHNVVPCWVASSKQEYSARTLRPKIHRLLPEYLTYFPKVVKQDPRAKIVLPQRYAQKIEWENLLKTVRAKLTPSLAHPALTWIQPGEKAAQAVFEEFLEAKVGQYAEQKNDPTKQALSNLSPYLHFGHISAQTIALQTQDHEVFFEELVIRKELAENFCFYNENYDTFAGLPAWGQKTLLKHATDTRDYVYSREEFEQGLTHDPAWNAAQQEMVVTGKMHGYMRMYWAKKILEWSKTPQEALETAIYLNDAYELDGRDPNGYTGIAWAIGGLHDRPWFERPVYGLIRYMNAAGLKRKFNLSEYINAHAHGAA